MDLGTLQKSLVEPSEEFTAQSVWNALWIPRWYDRDQDLVVGQHREYLFYEDVPGWIIRYMARQDMDCPALIFRGTDDVPNGRIISMTCEILEIRNESLGAIQSIDVQSFYFDLRLESGNSLQVNTEEMPGAIWNDADKIWMEETQNDEWAMSVKLRIIDRDPQKIFEVASAPKPFCSDVCSADAPGSALHDAAQTGDLEKVRQLIGEGIDVYWKNGFGDTSLFRAARRGHTEVVRLLLDSGANPNLQNHAGWNPLHTASVQGYTDIVKILLDAGGYVDNRNKNGWTPLFLASGSGHVEIVHILLDAGADILAEDANGNTPILTAQKKGYQEVVKLLKSMEKK